MNFFANQASYLRYFIPLIKEGNNKGIRSTFFWAPCGKYNSINKYIKVFQKLSQEFKFDIEKISGKVNNKSPVFLLEGAGREIFSRNIISLTSMVDYRVHYKNYIDKVENAIFPSEHMAKLFNCESPKNLYLGSPKYDIDFSLDSITKKYKLDPRKKNAFVILPKTRDLSLFAKHFPALYGLLHDLGFSIITKTRGKDFYSKFKGDYHFMDYSWFPHDSMELIYASDIIINFSSTSIKECILLNRPLVNFHIKPFKRYLPDLYKHDYCIDLPVSFNKKLTEESILELTTNDLSKEYRKAKDLYLFEPGNVSSSILEKFL